MSLRLGSFDRVPVTRVLDARDALAGRPERGVNAFAISSCGSCASIISDGSVRAVIEVIF